MSAWWVAVGALLLILDAGLLVAFRRRVPVARMALYTLPLSVMGTAVLVTGVVSSSG